jgi:hypothetical protein
MRATWLADVLRDAGLTVREVSGWKTRGSDSWGPVRGITCHHTAGARNSTDEGEINVLINGRPGLSGPIAQLYLSRTGVWWVIAAGHCNHNKIGTAGPNKGYGNDALLGVEAQHSGGTEPWTDVQYDSYVRGVAALVRHKASGWDVSPSRVAGHREHQPGEKSDPTFNMNSFRTQVWEEIADWEDDGMADITQDRFNTLFAKAMHEGEIGRSGQTFAQALDMIDTTLATLTSLARIVIASNESEVADDAAKGQAIAELKTSLDNLTAAIEGKGSIGGDPKPVALARTDSA